MSRKTKEELEQIKKQYGVNELWSWSKYNTYKNSTYEYYLKYILHKKEDRDDGAYTAYGSLCHDVLEKYYTNQIELKDISNEFEDGLLILDISDLKFDRSSEEKNKSIKSKYIYNLTHFINNHNIIKSKVEVEKFLTIKVGNNVFQGYADLIKKDNQNNIVIQDWKTSTIYKGEKALKEAGQLILYAEGLIQLGVPLNKIKICWNFLKYTTVTITQVNGKKVNRDIERIKLGESLKANCKVWLKKLGYINDVDKYIKTLIETNNIKCLPQEVQDKYELNDCYVFIDLTQDMINNLKVDIINTIHEINIKEQEFIKTMDEKIWYDTPENVEKQSFYFANLCGYSANLHKPYQLYLEKLNAQKNNTDIFGGIGEDLEDNILTNNKNINDINNENNDDYSWLNLI